MEGKLLEKRFIAVLVTLLLSSALLWNNHLAPGNFEQIVIWIVGLFMAGGAAEKWAEIYGATKKTV